jgi:hypothetical protein
MLGVTPLPLRKTRTFPLYPGISVKNQREGGSAADRTRTYNLLIRSQMLYPIELRLLQERFVIKGRLRGVSIGNFESLKKSGLARQCGS